MLKVYRMNDYDTVISDLSIEETNEWYKKEFDSENEIKDIKECTLDDGYWSEASLSDVVAELEFAENNYEIKAKKFSNTYWIWESFKESINRVEKNGYKKPILICSTEY
jgi:hypothetical protein